MTSVCAPVFGKIALLLVSLATLFVVEIVLATNDGFLSEFTGIADGIAPPIVVLPTGVLFPGVFVEGVLFVGVPFVEEPFDGVTLVVVPLEGTPFVDVGLVGVPLVGVIEQLHVPSFPSFPFLTTTSCLVPSGFVTEIV